MKISKFFNLQKNLSKQNGIKVNIAEP